MIVYSLEKVVRVLQEISKKFVLTEMIELKRVKYVKAKQHYLVTLRDESQHIVPQEFINTYIESFGEKGGLSIAGHLRHPIDLEQSVSQESHSDTGEYWQGDMNDVIDYLHEKKEDKE